MSESIPNAAPPTQSGARRILILSFGATGCMVMGVNSIMPMIPSFAREFAISQPTASLLITAFTLPGILFTLLAGMLADRFGRKLILTLSLLIFCLAGTACAFVDSFNAMLALRFIQGIGAAPLGVINATIIADRWSGRELTRYIGYNATFLNLCTAIYPTLGGILAHFNWRYPFLLSLLALPVFIISLRTPLANPGQAGSFRHYFGEISRIFHNRLIVSLFAITGITFLLLYGPLITCFPVLADSKFSASPALIGGIMVASSIGAGIAASQLERLYAHFSSRALLLFSQGVYCVSIILMAQFTDLAWILLPVLLFGMAQGINMPNVQTQLLNAASATERASVMSVNGTLLRLGQTLAPVGFSIVMGGFGINSGLYLGILLAVALSILTLLFIPKNPA
jgi:MFS family permease